MAWTLELFRTIDGLRLGELPLVDFSWERTVRDGQMDAPPQGAGEQKLSSFSFSLPALEAAGWIDRDQHDWQNRLLGTLMPVRHGIMALWDGAPITGGPIADTVRVTPAGVEIAVDGITSILRRRFIVPEQFAADRQIHYAGISLGSIAARVVQDTMQKPSGLLPITFDTPNAARRERTYQAFNVANLSVADVLEKIANVINGPDIDFRPYVRGPQHFAWHMHTGTETDPYIGQSTVHDWEMGSPDVETVEADLSCAHTFHRVYGVGGGQDIGTTVCRVDAEVPPEWPLLETVHTASDTEDVPLLTSYATARLNQWPVVQLRMTVRADGANPLGSFWPGETARVTVHDLPILTDGTYDLRILGMSGSAGKAVQLVFDPVVMQTW